MCAKMQASQQADRTFHLTFDYDPSKVKLCRVLGAEFKKDAGGIRWEVREPFICDLIKSVQKNCIIDGTDFYDSLVARCRALVEESQGSVDCEISLEIPPQKTLKHYQKSAIKWMIEHPNALVGDPMGSGKTISGSVFANRVGAKRVLILCPASVKVNWRRMWRAWNMMAHRGEQSVAIAQGSFWPNTDVVICNYDIIDRFRTKYLLDASKWPVPATYGQRFKMGKDERDFVVERVDDESLVVLSPEGKRITFAHDGEKVVEKFGEVDLVEWDLLIADECHRFKTPSAIRTRAIIGEWRRGRELQSPIRAKRKIPMSGTPILNRPEEIWPTAFLLWPTSFPSHHLFGMRYCAARRSKHGWNYSGSSNEAELNARLRILGMIARPQSLTHADLPPKTRTIIEFQLGGMSKILKKEIELGNEAEQQLMEFRARAEAAKVLQNEDEWKAAMKELRERVQFKDGELAKVRQEIAAAAVPHQIDHIREKLKEHGKAIVFSWHIAIAEAVARAFPNAALITGKVPSGEERQAQIDKFVNDPTCTVFVGTIASCGTGVDGLHQVASYMAFCEICYVPGEVKQAEDRGFRHGMIEREIDGIRHGLQIDYLVPEGSAMAVQCERLVDKLEIIDACTGPIQLMMESTPISIAVDESETPVGATPFDTLEKYYRDKVDPTLAYTDRDKLLCIARGQWGRRPAQVDQVICGRLANLPNWTTIQHALAHLMIERYGVEPRENLKGRAGLFG